MFEFIGSVLMFIFWFFVGWVVLYIFVSFMASQERKSPSKEEKNSQKEMFNKKSA